jgi:multicomponent Na+:H+ antiporter subunit E
MRSLWYRWTRRAGAMAAFAGYFLSRSLLGGLDVAGRVLHPRLPLDTSESGYDLTLRGDGARTLFVAVVSLLPGTLTADLVGQRVTVHSIAGDPGSQLAALERHVARLFGETGPVAES